MILHDPVDCLVLDKLNKGEPVGIPTETVYGLGAKIDSENALKRIFEIKSRPLFDPLIVHVANLEMAKSLVNPTEFSLSIIDSIKDFWPGPLTVVLEKNKERVPDIITSGFTTVGIRMPNNPKTLELIEEIGPLAAPSANPFQKTSPTSATDVENYFGPELITIDGGQCPIGIESTIIRFHEIPKKIEILRKGFIDPKLVKSNLEENIKCHFVIEDKTQKISNNSPGLFKEHYKPKGKVFTIFEEELEGITKFKEKNQNISKSQLVHLGDNPVIVARSLYRQLFSVKLNETKYFVLPSKSKRVKNSNLWEAIIERLEKASEKVI